MAQGHLKWDQNKLIDEKSRVQKSGETVPLIKYKCALYRLADEQAALPEPLQLLRHSGGKAHQRLHPKRHAIHLRGTAGTVQYY